MTEEGIPLVVLDAVGQMIPDYMARIGVVR